MHDSVFVEIEFLLLMLVSVTLPVSMYACMLWKRVLSRRTVLLFGCVLVAKSGVTIYLLQRLAVMARSTSSLLDERIFDSAFSLVLYFVPILFAGIGAKMLSHVLISYFRPKQSAQERAEDSSAAVAFDNKNNTAVLAVIDLASRTGDRRLGREAEADRRATVSMS